MKTTLLALVAITAIGAAIPAWADAVQFPTLTTDGLQEFKMDTFYPTNQTYIVQISLLYQVDDPMDIPNEVTWFDLSGTAHVVLLQEGMNVSHYPTEEPVDYVNVPKYTDEDVDRILENQREETKSQTEDAFGKLRQCLAEFKEISDNTGDQKYYAWQRIADLQEFDIPDQWVNANDYNKSELEAQKKWTICEALKKYRGVGAFEANKSLDEDDKPYGMDESDSILTIPVTQSMIDAEADKASKFACSTVGRQMGLCINYMTGEKYVVPPPTLDSRYGKYQDQRDESLDLESEESKSQDIQCETFFPLYNATDAIKIPKWLDHCQ